MTEKIDLDAIEERAEKATDMVSALCQVRGTVGSRRWAMSIPAQPNYDPDLVIAAALKHIPALIKLVKEQAEMISEAREKIEGYLIWQNTDTSRIVQARWRCDDCHRTSDQIDGIEHTKKCILRRLNGEGEE